MDGDPTPNPQQTTVGGEPFQRLDTTPSYPYTFGQYFKRLMWVWVSATFFRLSWPHAFRWRRWILRCFGAKLGPNTYIRQTTKIFQPWLLTMEEWSNLAAGVVVYNLGPVHVGKHTVISQGAYLCAGTHDYTHSNMPLEKPSIRIGNGVWIAAQAFIGPGVTVGDNSVIAARAVVAKDVPAGMVVGGNPAKVIKPREMKPKST